MTRISKKKKKEKEFTVQLYQLVALSVLDTP